MCNVCKICTKFTIQAYIKPVYRTSVHKTCYLTSETGQKTYVDNSYEYPANPAVNPSEIVKSWGEFKIDELDLNMLGEYRDQAIRIFDQTGWK